MPETDDDAFDAAADDFQRLSQILFERVTEFAEDEEVDDEVLPLLLLQMA